MRRREGFTLLELIVVITIIGIMGTFVVVKVTGMTYRAKAAKIQHDLGAIHQAAVAVEVSTGNWPNDIEECVHPPTEESVPGTLQDYPMDPWNNEYIYNLSDGDLVVSCLGKDGAEGGEEENRDYYYPKQPDY